MELPKIGEIIEDEWIKTEQIGENDDYNIVNQSFHQNQNRYLQLFVRLNLPFPIVVIKVDIS